MMREFFIFLFLLPLVLLCSLNANGAVIVSDYEAQFRVVPNESGRLEDVAVTLKITYAATNQTLGKGFKFVGTDKVRQVRVSDEHGDIHFSVDKLRETKISFNFTPIIRGRKLITIDFLLERALKNGLLSSKFNAPWLGNWNIPVDMARYSFVLPDKYSHGSIEANIPYTTTTAPSGAEIIAFEETPLKTRHLKIEISPAVSGHKLSFLIAWVAISLFAVIVSVIKRLRLPQPPIMDAQQPTPAEVAYLKKGSKHAVCVAIFDLIQRGFLQQAPERGHICQNASKKDDKAITTSYEYGVVSFFGRPATLRDLFANSAAIKAFKKELLDVLRRKGCLISSYDKQSFFSTVLFTSILAVIALIAMGGNLGIDTGVIVLSLAVPVICTIWAVVFLMSTVKSHRAMKVLSDFEQAIDRDNLILTSNQQYNPLLGYAIAIIGISILVGTIYDTLLPSISYARAMNAGTSTACSSCSSTVDGGSSSSSCSSCSSGGDGGGCGGCGGGGD
ncbi:MAG: TIGR04222 domain-containing membrane protein [Nitrospirae bacterium]|uniref:TIGR04222 domain-containing membrane protein n=1 Tax=Candidatus Magnetobacterium casense TaxID=1455061 RepID=UPI00058AFB97|nr:TIGR04222 domain-containing membrane protein [Candidatus Magnetobacterium casensis]MBF0337322.1 TIGR04222 domain-containing membrane protein [Nitrospirota bacterium]